MFISVLFRHQYAIYSYRGHFWVPTVILALEGIWIFFFGLVGFVRPSKRRQNTR